MDRAEPLQNVIEIGDCREIMARWISLGVKVDCIITSPPYWNLRDYKVKGQLGLEKTPAEYLENMVEVFELCKQLLSKRGTCWVNMGDSYASNGAQWSDGGCMEGRKHASARAGTKKVTPEGWRRKDMIGMPWRLAFALQAAGWRLRQDIIWHKPNPMPESSKDRCTKAHEYVFLLAKSRHYYFDGDAIAEPVSPDTHMRVAQKDAGKNGVNPKAKPVSGWDTGAGSHSVLEHNSGERKAAPRPRQNESFSEAISGGELLVRNKRSVWSIPTQPYGEAHFATFPEKLAETMLLAGCPPGGIALDPFMGSGTLAQVAIRHGRRYLGCELNPEYGPLQDKRTAQMALAIG